MDCRFPLETATEFLYRRFSCGRGFYVGGVIVPDCGSRPPVFVSGVIVGYGNVPMDYWIVRTSRGTGWGESGYFRIIRGSNACGITDYLAAPMVHWP